MVHWCWHMLIALIISDRKCVESAKTVVWGGNSEAYKLNEHVTNTV